MPHQRVRRNGIRRATTATLVATLLAVASPTPGTADAVSRPPRPAVTAREAPRAPAPTITTRPIAALDLATTTTTAPTVTADMRRALQARLDRIRKKYAIPGASVAVIFPDGTTWVGTTGFADVEAKTRVTPETAFAIASVSKTFTAALVMALSQEGRIALDAPVRTYLPDLKLNAKITVRQLLDHTSGLRDYFMDPRIDHALLTEPGRRWDEAEALDYVGKSYFKPGRGWHYSNTNYLVLGLLAERVGRKPLADQLRDRFIGPLGLSHTYYQPTESPQGPVAHGYRFPSTATDEPAIDLSDGSPIVPFTSVVTAAAGAGGIASTAGDLARWARALYEGGALTEGSVQAMVDDVGRTDRYRPSVPYGLGVQAAEVGGRPALGHSGRLLGFRALIRWLPEEAVAIAVLTNQSRTDPGIIARALVKIALKPSRPCVCTAVR